MLYNYNLNVNNKNLKYNKLKLFNLLNENLKNIKLNLEIIIIKNINNKNNVYSSSKSNFEQFSQNKKYDFYLKTVKAPDVYEVIEKHIIYYLNNIILIELLS